MEIDLNFDLENYIYIKLHDYLLEKSKFNPYVVDSTPEKLAKFPTVIFKEINNSDLKGYKTLDRTQRVDNIMDTVEIYTKSMVVGDTMYASKTIMVELKHLIIDFFEKYGFERLSCEPLDYYNHQVDRLLIVVRCSQNNWNKKIS